MSLMNTLATDASAPEHEAEADQVLEIVGVGWEGYRRYLRARGERSRPKMIYIDGDLLLVSPGQPHERLNFQVGLFLTEVFQQRRIHFRCLGQTTWRRRKRDVAVEGDQTYYITNEPLIRHKPKVDLRVDPPPDLAVELVYSHKADHALEVYARLGVPEVWVCDENRVAILLRQPNGEYREATHSLALPFLSAVEIHEQVQQPLGTSHLDFLDGLRQWVREVLVPRVHPT